MVLSFAFTFVTLHLGQLHVLNGRLHGLHSALSIARGYFGACKKLSSACWVLKAEAFGEDGLCK